MMPGQGLVCTLEGEKRSRPVAASHPHRLVRRGSWPERIPSGLKHTPHTGPVGSPGG